MGRIEYADPFLTELGIEPGQALSQLRVLRLIAVLTEFSVTLDQLAWNVWKQVAPKSIVASTIVKWDPHINWIIDEWWKVKTTDAEFDAPTEPKWFTWQEGSGELAINPAWEAKMPDEVKTLATETAAAIKSGEKKIERICDCDVEVKIFGVGGTIESLTPYVSIYQLANCAFTARLRIAWRDGRPEARYALAPAPGGQHLFYEAPVDIAVSAVNALRHLRQKADRKPGTTARVEHFGEIRRVFPLGDESWKETES